ncbi:DUF4249 domain-containing protein [uncultured Parabacteroides sp.]|jgi:hypothetical protein|uniref:DUF4249 domain-containing protein n=1 Tax=uncultured Parabacteroides sp. TaxID=512312 RepID=UPI0025E056AF|nr:DUF4249 domain-containing protein [uncultured Parabacteroides sp.]
MKYLIKHTILFILLSIIFSSCVKYVDLEHLRPDPKLVLNCVAQTGMPLTATVSRTWFYTDENPNITIEDAKISLYVNGQYREDMTWHVEESEYNSAAYYKASYIPSDGDKIRLEVEKDGFKDISAECVLPVKPELLKLEVVREKDTGSYGYYSYRTVYRTTLKDKQQEGDCYLVRVMFGSPDMEYDEESGERVFTGTYYWSSNHIDYSYEPVFKNKISVLDELFGNDWLSGYGGRPFSDELINGQEYTLKLAGYSYGSSYPPEGYPEENPNGDPPSYVKVYLYTLSESYYQYLMALAELNDLSLNNDLVDAGLAEPIRVLSNVVGGTGILGAASVDTLTVEVPYGY